MKKEFATVSAWKSYRFGFEWLSFPLFYCYRFSVNWGMKVAGRYVILFWVDDVVMRIERVVYGGRNLPPLFDK